MDKKLLPGTGFNFKRESDLLPHLPCTLGTVQLIFRTERRCKVYSHVLWHLQSIIFLHFKMWSPNCPFPNSPRCGCPTTVVASEIQLYFNMLECIDLLNRLSVNLKLRWRLNHHLQKFLMLVQPRRALTQLILLKSLWPQKWRTTSQFQNLPKMQHSI